MYKKLKDTHISHSMPPCDKTCVIMKTMCPPSYHHTGFVATYALGHMMYDYTLLVPTNQIVLKRVSRDWL